MTFSCINHMMLSKIVRGTACWDVTMIKEEMDFLAEMGKEDIILRYSKQIKDHQALLLKSCREVLDK